MLTTMLVDTAVTTHFLQAYVKMTKKNVTIQALILIMLRSKPENKI